MDTLLQLGHLHQLVVVSGYIPHDLVIATDSENNYQMRFNIRTYDNDGFATLLPCVAYGDIAKNLHDQLTNKDSVVLWGQLKTRYDRRVKDTYMTIKVISYSISALMINDLTDGVLNDEKKEYIEWALRKFDKNAPKPTDEEIAFWRERRRENAEKWRKKK